MPVAERLGRLGRIRLDEEGVRLRQRHCEVVQLAPYAADHADSLAEVDLRVPRRVRQRHENFARPALPLPHIVGDDRQLAREAVLVAQPLEDPRRRVPLLRQLAFVVLQDPVDDRNKGIELRPDRRFGPTIPRWHRVCQDLRHRLAVDAEHPRRFALAHPVDMARPTHPPIKVHSIHLPAFSSLPQAQDAEFYSATVSTSDRFRCPFCLRDSQPCRYACIRRP